MKITVKSKEDKVNINLIVPIGVLTTLLRVSKPFIKIDFSKHLKNSNADYIFGSNDVDVIIQGLKYLNKEHKGLHLVDIEQENGDIVKIKI
ncbi:hypothetical protein [Romboutsia lituseburensis]|uniref:Uncharacterized protein n=1 Tax=Romboutsia lituseburensis DSM 797 TaxID=1121325 RepID=A0A1G9TAQ9_9FIRM|nr:hypothetical protein [Romboutsia lituseburensis]CEH36274.1 Hypothetical protein RLITU_3716 [Romboutsia lituseburensis]SDM44736.1 hypothetical protein SAMN04515677_11235 [Romboutsia lituseburensis DSM 797]